MTNHPITPPPELVEEWRTQPEFAEPGLTSVVSMTQSRLRDIATQAAQWGADQELKACCEWITGQDWTWTSSQLRNVRRPKPPSLKEQALEALEFVDEKLDLPLHNHCNAIHTIRRALEALDD